MNLLRLAAWLTLAQCLIASAAFAGDPIPTPEPTTLALLGAGVAGIALVKKFRNRK